MKNMVNIELNNKTETRLNPHSMALMVSHNKILSVNEMNDNRLIFFCSFPDKIL